MIQRNFKIFKVFETQSAVAGLDAARISNSIPDPLNQNLQFSKVPRWVVHEVWEALVVPWHGPFKHDFVV